MNYRYRYRFLPLFGYKNNIYFWNVKKYPCIFETETVSLL